MVKGIFLCRRCTRLSIPVDQLDGGKENLLLFLQVDRQLGCHLIKNGGDLDYFGMMSVMDLGDLMRICRYLSGIFLDIGMVDIYDIINQKRQLL